MHVDDGRQVLHFQPVRQSRFSQALELTREEAIKLWDEIRKADWQVCTPQWTPPPPLRPR